MQSNGYRWVENQAQVTNYIVRKKNKNKSCALTLNPSAYPNPTTGFLVPSHVFLCSSTFCVGDDDDHCYVTSDVSRSGASPEQKAVCLRQLITSLSRLRIVAAESEVTLALPFLLLHRGRFFLDSGDDSHNIVGIIFLLTPQWMNRPKRERSYRKAKGWKAGTQAESRRTVERGLLSNQSIRSFQDRSIGSFQDRGI
jgi:hypothetical protein